MGGLGLRCVSCHVGVGRSWGCDACPVTSSRRDACPVTSSCHVGLSCQVRLECEVCHILA